MLKLGQLEIEEVDQLEKFGDYPNIKRLLKHVKVTNYISMPCMIK